ARGRVLGSWQDARTTGGRRQRQQTAGESLALARLVPAIRLVDNVKAPATAYHAVVAVALAQGPERILDLHAKRLATVKGIGPCERNSLARPRRTISRAARPVNGTQNRETGRASLSSVAVDERRLHIGGGACLASGGKINENVV